MNPRWYQEEAELAAWHWFATREGNPLIDLPTGAGKSLVIAMLAHRAKVEFGARSIVLAHRAELLEQNADKLRAVSDLQFTVGLYSAGLRKKQANRDVTVAGIQSCYRHADRFGEAPLIIVDEAHLVPSSGEGMYRQFLADMRSCNPQLRVVGLTATPFRLDSSGGITGPDRIFQGICYSVPVLRLVNEDFLARMINTPSSLQIATDGIRKSGGEFVEWESEKAFLADDNVIAACREIVEKCSGRRSVLVFTCGVKHCEEVAETLAKLTGEKTEIITGDTLPIARAETIRRFREGELRWLTNVNVLTTGFDAPNVDCVVVLRPTQSAGLFAQMLGRGFRISSSKEDCLLLDFGGNLQRFGPIDSPDYGKRDSQTKGDGEGDAPTKICPACGAKVPAGTKVCGCGFAFPLDPKSHETQADENSKIYHELEPPQSYDVMCVTWGKHIKRNDPEAPPTLRIDYECQPTSSEGGNLSMARISEWVCVEHQGFARTKAVLWWQARSNSEAPSTVRGAIDLLDRGACAAPQRIIARKEGRWWRIERVEIDPNEIPETWAPPREETGEVDEWGEPILGEPVDVPF